jgi:hypothetical protein
VFDRHIKEKAKRDWRLLIVDGHSSHVNLEFLEACKRLRIVVLILPPHSTHRLQPLDVGLFLPLSNYYSLELDRLMHISDGITRLTKRNFWNIFKKSWNQAFTEKNIKSAFAKTGINPQDAELIMAQIKPEDPPKPTTPLRKSRDEIRTPYSAIALRRAKKEWRINPNKALVEKVLKANEKLHARAQIAEYRCEGLREALQEEKKKRTKGVKLDLRGKPDAGSVFWSPPKIDSARAYKNKKDAEIEQDMIDKELRKAAQKAKEELEELYKQEKRNQRELKAQISKESKAAQKKTTVQRKTRQKPVKPVESGKKMAVLRSKSACEKNKQLEMVVLEGEPEEVVRRTNRGRSTRMPLRFRT